MNTSTQLKALIRNIAKEKSVQAEIILRNFMLERLLEWISLSSFRDKFILKGGMLIAAIVGIDTRSTMDMDATIRGIPLSETALAEAMKEILVCPVDDGVKMTLKGFENIQDESEYQGIRVSIEAILDKTRQVMKVDITTGDKITPKAGLCVLFCIRYLSADEVSIDKYDFIKSLFLSWQRDLVYKNN